ncbi:sulfotransferase 1E1-like [Daphnia pulicaria]|uniref:sulfotransferase 1E1-like n=1 Tax=Daphnia pulicaria TaxID=35523 RepID=UPI001EEA7068|nr:sulfotransferase 1E1-like [Daphnia pulicaria]
MALHFEFPDAETKAKLLAAFPGYSDGFVRCQPGNLLMPLFYKKDWKTYYDFQLRDDDVFILSFPKSGTTWTQDMVWLIANDCDFQGAKKLLRERVPFLEDRSLGTDESLQKYLEMSKNNTGATSDIIIEPNFIDALPSPRFIKSHLPLSCLPPTLVTRCKVVYVARNPKDVAVSWYFHHLLDPIMNTNLTIEEFAEFFMRDEVLYAPYWTSVIEAWEKRNDPNFLFLFYEDLKMDLPAQLHRICQFLGKEELPIDQIIALTEHLKFDNFKINKSVNAQELQEAGYFKKEGNFMRKGQIGDWKNHFGEKLNSRFDEWIEKCTSATDLKFPK